MWAILVPHPVPIRWPNEEETRNLTIGYFEDDGCTPVTAETRGRANRRGSGAEGGVSGGADFVPKVWRKRASFEWKVFCGGGCGMVLRPMFERRERDLSPTLKDFLHLSSTEPKLTADTVLEAWIKRDLLRARFFAQMQHGNPILLCPVGAIPAFRHRERSWQVGGQNRPISRRVELYGVLQSDGQSGGGRSCRGSPARPLPIRGSRSLTGRGKKSRSWPLPGCARKTVQCLEDSAKRVEPSMLRCSMFRLFPRCSMCK